MVQPTNYDKLRPEPKQLFTTVAVKEEIEDRLDEMYGPLNKRSKLAEPAEQLESMMVMSSPLCDPLEEPSPLGLRLKKSPSFLDMIQMRLSQGTPVSTSSFTSSGLETEKKNELNSTALSSSVDKMKASNFPASILRIGNWEDTTTRHPGESLTSDDAASSITCDGLMAFRGKFHFSKDLVVMAPKKFDRARAPPSGFITVYEMTLRAGLRFPPAPELIEICVAFGIAPSQFSYRIMVTVMGLITFFREHGTTLTMEFLSLMCKFSSDSQGRISCKSNKEWLDLPARYLPKNWITTFFFVKNDWGLPEKWGRLKNPLSCAHIEDEDILKILGIPNVATLHYELCRLGQCVTEERLFKAGLSIQEGRSRALPLKNSTQGCEVGSNIEGMLSNNLFEDHRGDKSSPSRKKKKKNDSTTEPSDKECYEEGTKTLASADDIVILDPDTTMDPLKVHIPGGLLKHMCHGGQQITDVLIQKRELEARLTASVEEWNLEFVKVKFLKDEYARKLVVKTNKIVSLEDQLAGCRSEIANMSTSLSSQQRAVDSSRMDLMYAQVEIRSNKKKIISLQKERKNLVDLLAEREAEIEAHKGAIALKAVEDFKGSLAYSKDIQGHIQKARDEIYDIEVKDLEQQSLKDGFIRGFLKGIRLMHRKTGANIEEVSPSQASQDSSSDSGDDIEGELRKGLSSDDEDAEIV